jgi:hypothetical protein
LFNESQKGCLNAFRQIAEKYRYNSIVFEYEDNKGMIKTVTGTLFKFKEQQILFRLKGVYKKDVQILHCTQFRKTLRMDA